MTTKTDKSKKILTTVDISVVKFLEEHRLVMTTSQISRLFYKTDLNSDMTALNRAQKRLKVLVEKGELKRARDYVSQENIYYLNKAPRNAEHKLLIAETIIKFSKFFKVTKIKVEFNEIEKPYSLRPDIYFEIEDEKFGRINLIVECDITKDFSNVENYKKLLQRRDSNEVADEENKLYKVRYYFKKGKTVIISVCDRQPDTNGLNVVWLRTDFSNFYMLTDLFK